MVRSAPKASVHRERIGERASEAGTFPGGLLRAIDRRALEGLLPEEKE